MRRQGELQAAAQREGADGRDGRDGEGGDVGEGRAEEGEEGGGPGFGNIWSPNGGYNGA